MGTLRIIVGVVVLLGLCVAQSIPDLTQEEAIARLTNRVAPVYPPLARQARIQGEVVIRFTISEEGVTTNIRLVSGHPLLSPAALDAVKQWRFRPYEVDDEPVAADTQVSVKFTLGPTAEQRADLRRDAWVKEYEQRSGARVFRSTDDIVPPTIVSNRNAIVPPRVSTEISDGVAVWCIVDAAGNVIAVEAEAANAAIRAAAENAAGKWRFRPARDRGLPVAYLYTGRVYFNGK